MMVRHTTQVSATNIIGALWIDWFNLLKSVLYFL
jgi:hypothetical protein